MRFLFARMWLCWLFSASLCLAAINPTVAPDVFHVSGSTRKICQLAGDNDFQWTTPTENKTQTRYGMTGTDLGVPFTHKGLTVVLFGDTWGGISGDRDAIAFTTDVNPEDGLALDFSTNGSTWRPITIPGISQGAFEVPLDGVSVSNNIYLYHSTDHSPSTTMGRSVVAVSTNDGLDFRLLYTLSRTNFINVSVNKLNLADWPGFPQTNGEGLVLFGSGDYRASNVRLAFQPVAEIEKPSVLLYFTGLDGSGEPSWSTNEGHAIELFDQPTVGELSVAYNKFIRRWVMLYNAETPRGINFRTARQPWGPWSQPQVLFDPWGMGGYGHFLHIPEGTFASDNVHNNGRSAEWGGEYGPYMFKELAIGSDNRTTIYFTMSTWNPYIPILMKAELSVTNAPIITLQPTAQKVSIGESASFEIAASVVGTPSYTWMKNGTPISGATARTLIVTNAGVADDNALFQCRVANSIGAVTSNPVRLTLTAGNQAPEAEIQAGGSGNDYSAGETIFFSGVATDPEDGLLLPSAFYWRVLFYHANHSVPFLTLNDTTSGSFTVPSRGENATNVSFRIYLTVKDSGGRETTVFRDLVPRKTVLTLQTEPPGLRVVFDGQTMTTPTNLVRVTGSNHDLRAVALTNFGGRAIDFMAWSDGGPLSHTITQPETNSTLTASYRSAAVLVATNSVWKYNVTSAAPPATWKVSGYDDIAWPTGTAQLGYGDGDEATTIGWGPISTNRYVTTYFRQAFAVADPSVFSSLLVRLLRDDGGVVYLNGTEIFRSNLGGGVPLWKMLAPAAALVADETSTYYSTNISSALLQVGTNILAVEIHQNSVNNSADLSFALELRGVEFDPQLSMKRVNQSLIISWPAPAAGCILEAASTLAPGIWTNAGLPPVITNGQNQVILPSSSNAQFFRLRRP